MRKVEPGGRGNHSVRHHRLILRAVPPGARTALDVGTGDGLLAHDLRRRVPHVTGLDLDPAVLERARALDDRVTWVQGDVLTHPFPADSFDVVASVATLHQLPDLDAALRRLADLTAPGGVLAIVGLARGRTLPGRTATTGSPHTYAEVRRAAALVLPRMRWRRLPRGRYAIVWTKPLPVPAESPAEALLRLALRVPRVLPEA